MTVFENKQRTDPAVKRRGEPTYDLYDRAAGEKFQAVRDLINAWATAFPENDRDKLVSEIMTGDNQKFNGALAELIMHAALVKLGFRVEAHPMLAWTKKTPDFLLRDSFDRRLAYVEVTTINPSPKAIGGMNREHQLFLAIDELDIPGDLRLVYEIGALGQMDLRKKPLCGEIERWAAENAENARKGVNARREFQVDDWRLSLTLTAGFGNMPGSHKIAMWSDAGGNFFRVGSDMVDLGRVLDGKVARYGALDLPYLITVFDEAYLIGSVTGDLGGDVAAALFDRDFTEDRVVAGQTIESKITRTTMGWMGQPESPRNTGASAVLVFPHASIGKLGDPARDPLLVHHPWADHPLPVGLLPFNRLEMNVKQGHVIAGRNMSDILDLPDPWPPVR